MSETIYLRIDAETSADQAGWMALHEWMEVHCPFAESITEPFVHIRDAAGKIIATRQNCIVAFRIHDPVDALVFRANWARFIVPEGDR